uniref:Uncharacterized protein n=1 Tax=Acrobeloides nanus TaxID=290746 RepID=A0A914C009_9BILA
MDASSNNPLLFDYFKYAQLKPNVFLIDVLGDNIQVGSNTEWRKLGEAITQHIIANNQGAVLLSIMNLEDILTTSPGSSTPENSAHFDHNRRTYTLTSLDPAHLHETLPDIIESEEFLDGLNVWLCFFEKQETSAQELCHDEGFLKEIKHMLSNLSDLALPDLSYELIAGVPDGLEMLWYNPRFKTTNPLK